MSRQLAYNGNIALPKSSRQRPEITSEINVSVASLARFAVLLGLLCSLLSSAPIHAQQRREREPNNVYAERRAKIAEKADGPVSETGCKMVHPA